MYWHGGYNPLELSCPLWIGTLVLGPWIFTLHWSCKVCSHPSLKIPEEATIQNYTTDSSAVISDVFFFSIDFPTRGGKILILSPTTTLLWIKFFNFANCDERWHFRESDPEKIQNWPISPDEFLITRPESLWHIGCVTMTVMGHTARLAECLWDPRESSSEKADKIRKCLRQVLQGQETRWRRGRNSQKAVLLYFIILLGLGFALKILNLEENGSGNLRCTSAMFICSNLKVAISFFLV